MRKRNDSCAPHNSRPQRAGEKTRVPLVGEYVCSDVNGLHRGCVNGVSDQADDMTHTSMTSCFHISNHSSRKLIVQRQSNTRSAKSSVRSRTSFDHSSGTSLIVPHRPPTDPGRDPRETRRVDRQGTALARGAVRWYGHECRSNCGPRELHDASGQYDHLACIPCT